LAAKASTIMEALEMGKAYHQADGHHGPDFTAHQVAEEEETTPQPTL